MINDFPKAIIYLSTAKIPDPPQWQVDFMSGMNLTLIYPQRGYAYYKFIRKIIRELREEMEEK